MFSPLGVDVLAVGQVVGHHPGEHDGPVHVETAEPAEVPVDGADGGRVAEVHQLDEQDGFEVGHARKKGLLFSILIFKTLY